MIANVALDYTEWAPPLTIGKVRMDVDCYASQACRSPHKIIMWVHQWEYLVKQHKDLMPKYVVTEVKADTVGINFTARPAESSDGGRLWGIKVEVRDPKEHAA
jgi:hypothetical protein